MKPLSTLFEVRESCTQFDALRDEMVKVISQFMDWSLDRAFIFCGDCDWDGATIVSVLEEA